MLYSELIFYENVYTNISVKKIKENIPLKTDWIKINIFFSGHFLYVIWVYTEKNGFVTATKLGTTNNFLLLQPKILLQQPNVLLIELNILL